ncbi:MAG: TlpA family protein disulfide reductase [Anaerolineae bacterium]|nr:TlpA family protein disulfide reductase [Anaerolineae bacterium]
MSAPRSRRRGVTLALVGLTVVAVVALGVWLGGRGNQGGVVVAAGRPLTVERDQLAPLFRLTTLDGETVDLADSQGDVVLVNFWATWCPPCRAEMPVIEAAYQAHKDKGFRVLAVDVREGKDEVAAYARELGLSFPVLLDQNGDVTLAYRVQNLPRSFLIDRQGRVVRIHPGELTPETIERYLQELL